MDKNQDISDICREVLAELKIRDSGILKMQQAITEELRQIENAPPKPIMTLTEVADYLRIDAEMIENYLGEIPCFELGGKILFRKDSVDEWIKDQEKNYLSEITESRIQNVIKFTVA